MRPHQWDGFVCQRHGGSAMTNEACPTCIEAHETQKREAVAATQGVPEEVTPAETPSAKGIEVQVSTRDARVAFLERKRIGTKADLLLKFEDGDWHGVADASMDLRDIDSELAGLRFE